MIVIITENCIGVDGETMIFEGLKRNTTLTTLNIDGMRHILND